MLTVKASTTLSIPSKAEIDVWCAYKKNKQHHPFAGINIAYVT